MSEVPASQPDQLPPGLIELLASIHLGPPVRLVQLQPGGNNRVYRVEAGDRAVLLKWYYFHPDDQRDRLAAEFAFVQFAWQRAVRVVPEPLAASPEHRLALYQLLPGRRLAADQITPGHVQAALDFFQRLNRHRHEPAALQLPPASESCFSVQEHLACVQCRIDALQAIPERSPVDRQAARLVREQLLPAWRQLADQVRRQAGRWQLPLDQPLEQASRCLSPSDFGFHNALVDERGTVRFCDFEYAGWDDPAKMVCDFFCQVEVPVPLKYLDQFTDQVAASDPQPELVRRRVELLLPLHRLKWCCLLLNEFLPAAGRRRRFSRGVEDFQRRKEQQLEKAGRLWAAAAAGSGRQP